MIKMYTIQKRDVRYIKSAPSKWITMGQEIGLENTKERVLRMLNTGRPTDQWRVLDEQGHEIDFEFRVAIEP